jgi:hypothetical protein
MGGALTGISVRIQLEITNIVSAGELRAWNSLLFTEPSVIGLGHGRKAQ